MFHTYTPLLFVSESVLRSIAGRRSENTGMDTCDISAGRYNNAMGNVMAQRIDFKTLRVDVVVLHVGVIILRMDVMTPRARCDITAGSCRKYQAYDGLM